ncbi:MAG TPA: PEP-CTERM sorting domain-containing protein [Thiobacillaceae bacterium]|nr:PEP-CTERM sorting domain-containing protein [Thiobacillaceae bacterium]
MQHASPGLLISCRNYLHPAALSITGANTFDPTVELPLDPGAELTFRLTVMNTAAEKSSDDVNILISSVPEPSTGWLFGLGVLALLGAARLHKRSV